MTVSFHPRGNYQTFKKHLKKVLYQYRAHSKIIMVVDNVRFHHAKLPKKWLKTKPKLELMYLPPYSPELNPIERAWWYMRKKITHNRHLQTLEERKVAFWKMFSHFQKPNKVLLYVCEINFRLYINSFYLANTTLYLHVHRTYNQSIIGFLRNDYIIST